MAIQGEGYLFHVIAENGGTRKLPPYDDMQSVTSDVPNVVGSASGQQASTAVVVTIPSTCDELDKVGTSDEESHTSCDEVGRSTSGIRGVTTMRHLRQLPPHSQIKKFSSIIPSCYCQGYR